MRELLIDAGIRLFTAKGYAATSTSALLAEAGVSKGALYHHFPSKEALFEAIFEHVARESIARATRKPLSGSGVSQLDVLIDGALRWLRESRRPPVSNILLEEGPRVLGFERARRLEEKYSLGLMTRGLELAANAGEIAPADLELSARLINAALGEAALISTRPGRRPTRATIEQAIRKLITGLTRP